MPCFEKHLGNAHVPFVCAFSGVVSHVVTGSNVVGELLTMFNISGVCGWWLLGLTMFFSCGF